MSRRDRTRTNRTAFLAGAAASLALLGSSPALAQAAGCGDVQKYLQERQAIGQALAKLGKKNIDPGLACVQFTKMVANGNALLKWVSTNKDWCQIPDSFSASMKDDHGKAQSIRAKACGVAAKQAQIQKQAREGGGQNGQSGLLGGGGLSGASRLPQGAL